MLQIPTLRFTAAKREIELHHGQGIPVQRVQPQMQCVTVGYEHNKDKPRTAQMKVEAALRALNPVRLSSLPGGYFYQVTLPPATKALNAAWKTLGEYVKSGVIRFATPALKYAQDSSAVSLLDTLNVQFKEKKDPQQLAAWGQARGLELTPENQFEDTQAQFRFVKLGWKDMIKRANQTSQDPEVTFSIIDSMGQGHKDV